MLEPDARPGSNDSPFQQLDHEMGEEIGQGGQDANVPACWDCQKTEADRDGESSTSEVGNDPEAPIHPPGNLAPREDPQKAMIGMRE